MEKACIVRRTTLAISFGHRLCCRGHGSTQPFPLSKAYKKGPKVAKYRMSHVESRMDLTKVPTDRIALDHLVV